MRHFLEIDDLHPGELHQVLDLAEDPAPPAVMSGRGMALIFEKPSARTRNSMEMAVVQLGGHPVSIRGDEIGLDVRESTEDVARTLSCYHAAIGARVFEHSKVERLALSASVPVVNLLSDQAHPCQALADLLTVRQTFGCLQGLRIAYIGDFNNVARSLSIGGAACGMDMQFGCPTGYRPTRAHLDRLSSLGSKAAVFDTALEAAEGADVVYTDVWTSMGQEAESSRRRIDLAGFTVDDAVMGAADPGAILLHCLPAHRGEEVSDSVLDGPQSRVWLQAANRMHAQRGLLVWLLTEANRKT